jgi:prepilin-type N-terminal cleavage/methylation domain-containing protein/prepilin-type processing-associated H-X9-DG protein
VRTRSLRAGFTLVELLMVLAILAVLFAILLPVLLRAKAGARNATCVTHLGEICRAARMYADDNDRTIVPARTAVTAFGTKGITWCVILQPYLRSDKILICAEDKSPQPAAQSTDVPHSYGINYNLAYNNLWGPYPFVTSMSFVQRTSDVILFFEILGSVQAMGSAYTSYGISRVDARHNGRGNFAFLDGHVKGYTPTQVRNPAYWDPFVSNGS